MKSTKIYLRSIDQDNRKRLSLFDSNRKTGIDELITEVQSGGTIIWTFDCCSGIKSIIKIYSKSGKGNIFKNEPVKGLFCKYFKLKIPIDAKGEEAYGIDYQLLDGTKLSIDPVIRIKPPQ